MGTKIFRLIHDDKTIASFYDLDNFMLMLHAVLNSAWSDSKYTIEIDVINADIEDF